MHWPTRPPVVNEQQLIPLGLYRTFTVGYYMGRPPRVPMHEEKPDVLGDLPKGRYTRQACACKILGSAKCPVHGKHTGDAGCPVCRSFGGGRMGQGCAEPTSATPGEGSYQGGDIPAGASVASGGGIPTGAVIGIGAAGLAGILWLAGVI